jgi:CBS domain-containing protein
MRLKVKDIMTADPVCVPPDLPFKEVADLMLERRIRGVPVVDDAGKVLGVITESDLLVKPAYAHEHRHEESGIRHFLARLRHRDRTEAGPRRVASDIMSSPPVTASPWDDVEDATQLMLERGISRLPVLREGRLVGIVSRHDLVRQFDKTDEEIAADVEQALHDPLLAESEPQVAVTVDDGVVLIRGTVRYPRDVEVLATTVAGIGGVVDVRSEVTAAHDEPAPPPASAPFEEQSPRYY